MIKRKPLVIGWLFSFNICGRKKEKMPTALLK